MPRSFVGRRPPHLMIKEVIILLCAVWGSALADREELECYQCVVEMGRECTDADLKPCPNDQAYDVCMVSVTKNAGHVVIERKCALGPCSLRDPIQSYGLGLDNCDRSQNTYSCFECCKGSGCNKSSDYGLRASSSSDGQLRKTQGNEVLRGRDEVVERI